MTTSSAMEQESFAQSAQLALQRLAQAQMTLAFLGNNERAHRITTQLNGAAELVGAMQADHAALLLDQAKLEELIDEASTRRPWQGLVVEPIDREEQAYHRWSTRLALFWVRFRGLILLGALGVVLAVTTGVAGHASSITGPTVAGTRSGTSAVAYLGDTMSAGSLNCTLLGEELNAVDQAYVPNRGRYEPPSGPPASYLTIYIQLLNTGTRSVAYGPSEFHVKVGTGKAMSEEPAVNGNLASGDMAPGERVEGNLVFKVQQGNHTTELTWTALPRGYMDEYAWLLDL